MAKWKVEFKGFAYIEADTQEEAEEMFDNDETYYEEKEQTIKQVDVFVVESLNV